LVDMLFSTALHNRVTDNPEYYLKIQIIADKAYSLGCTLEALSLEGTKQQGWLTNVIEDN